MPVLTDSYPKIKQQLKVCPTCLKPLQDRVRDGHLTLRCPDLYHGFFEITKVQAGYLVTYHMTIQQLS